MFNGNSGLVKIWVDNIQNKGYTEEQIPNISNLRIVVIEVLATPVV